MSGGGPFAAGRILRSLAEEMAERTLAERITWFDSLPPHTMQTLPWDWPFWTHPAQAVPPGQWRT